MPKFKIMQLLDDGTEAVPEFEWDFEEDRETEVVIDEIADRVKESSPELMPLGGKLVIERVA